VPEPLGRSITTAEVETRASRAAQNRSGGIRSWRGARRPSVISDEPPFSAVLRSPSSCANRGISGTRRPPRSFNPDAIFARVETMPGARRDAVAVDRIKVNSRRTGWCPGTSPFSRPADSRPPPAAGRPRQLRRVASCADRSSAAPWPAPHRRARAGGPRRAASRRRPISPQHDRVHLGARSLDRPGQRRGGAAPHDAPGKRDAPKFSPDGKWIAVHGQLRGSDLYVIPSTSGTPSAGDVPGHGRPRGCLDARRGPHRVSGPVTENTFARS